MGTLKGREGIANNDSFHNIPIAEIKLPNTKIRVPKMNGFMKAKEKRYKNNNRNLRIY